MSGRPTAKGSVVGFLLALLVVLAGVLYAGDRGASPTAHTGPAWPSGASVGGGHVPAGTLDPAAASAALARLRVAGKGSLAGYERSCDGGAGCVFGPAWADVDHNGCDQRDDVLHRDLTGIRVRSGTTRCVVLSGTLADPYTGTTVGFAKARADEVQIDHVVPLAAAWAQGASRWSAERRRQFANDPGNLIATTRHPNESKGDDTADEWLPPDAGYGCSYATVIVTVKQRYALTVTAAEAGALRRLLATC